MGITNKKALNKIQLPSMFTDKIQKYGYEILSIHPEHISKLDDFPMFHRDPFDRILIAQSIYENTPLVTRDAEIAKYKIHIITL